MSVILNQNLSWKSHINYLASKIAKSADIIYKSKFYLPSKSLLLLYYSLFYPYLHYCNLAWASTYSVHVKFEKTNSFTKTNCAYDWKSRLPCLFSTNFWEIRNFESNWNYILYRKAFLCFRIVITCYPQVSTIYLFPAHKFIVITQHLRKIFVPMVPESR